MSDVESDAASVDSEAKDLQVNDLMNPDIVTKYRLAADIANRASHPLPHKWCIDTHSHSPTYLCTCCPFSLSLSLQAR